MRQAPPRRAAQRLQHPPQTQTLSCIQDIRVVEVPKPMVTDPQV